MVCITSAVNIPAMLGSLRTIIGAQAKTVHQPFGERAGPGLHLEARRSLPRAPAETEVCCCNWAVNGVTQHSTGSYRFPALPSN